MYTCSLPHILLPCVFILNNAEKCSYSYNMLLVDIPTKKLHWKIENSTTLYMLAFMAEVQLNNTKVNETQISSTISYQGKNLHLTIFLYTEAEFYLTFSFSIVTPLKNFSMYKIRTHKMFEGNLAFYFNR